MNSNNYPRMLKPVTTPDGYKLPCVYYHTLVIGSGSASLSAAVRLKRAGIYDLCVITDDLEGGTSRNTGSDKQTYYKLSDSSRIPDSPYSMAESLFTGGAMHGDIALIEAIGSESSFYNLISLGVPFPHNRWGGYTGYKTDHDPRTRGVSLGPYTSKKMVESLEAECQVLDIEILNRHECVKLFRSGDRIAGALVLTREEGKPTDNPEQRLKVFLCDNMVFGPGGPAGLYEASVYPPRHTGAIGLALEIGAEAVNLTESQYGITSTEFRWNLSGSFQQVIPHYYSLDPQTGEKYPFLNGFFPSMKQLSLAVFRKGYQWPFDALKIAGYGSSLIDLLVYQESVIRGREVFMDFRVNLQGNEDIGFFSPSTLEAEAADYWRRSGLSGKTPVERLKQMNPGALELYKSHNIDLHKRALKIAVSAQHNNGGLAGDIWWESTNISHLFPVGEVNGSHGVARPGGSALNSGQVGALRAAQKISNVYKGYSLDLKSARLEAEKNVASLMGVIGKILTSTVDRDNLKSYRTEFRIRMSSFAALIRNPEKIDQACREASRQQEGFTSLRVDNIRLAAALRLRHQVLAHRVYLEAVGNYLSAGGGSRGSFLVSLESPHEDNGVSVVPDIGFIRFIRPENPGLNNKLQLVRWNRDRGLPEFSWIDRRPLPEADDWFENVWARYNSGEIFTQEVDSQ